MATTQIDLSMAAPPACDSNKVCNYRVGANGTAPVLVTSVGFVFRNVQTGGNIQLNVNFASPTNINAASGGITVSLDVTFNDILGVLRTPGIMCGGAFSIQVEAVAAGVNPDGSPNGIIHQSCDPSLPTNCATTEVSIEPCICTEILDVFTTIDSFPCVSEDGTIGIQGKLFEVTCGGGIPSPLANLPGTAGVLVGLQDPKTGIFYEYVGAGTDNTGTFSIAFAVSARMADVIPLIPVNGNKQFNLMAFYPGTLTHSPSASFIKGVTISGRQAGSVPCSLGTLLKDTVFATAPQGATVHVITQGFAGGIPGVSDFNALANQITSKVHDAIISAGTSTEPVTPLEIKVYRGPDIQVPTAFGFIGVSSGSFMVVSTAIGSPIAPIIIAAAIIALAIVVLAVFVFLIFSTVKDIIVAGGGPVLEAGAIAIAIVAVAAVAGLILYTRRRR